ncbi:ABC transporter permease [Bacteroides ovatus]|uniref:ABC transporter permease n=1 Tax=Bacteroides ovatus TaxID=28116 RepID=UPI001C37A352|nr:ABC transporter permease [Bacteroides ovatus]MBV3314724.1 ABC transporter permease [Bacteroides ovatus]MCS2299445.1 ABC transporter permease [Bacteroides ovatus]UYI65762.1 MAG: ABC transporter permease [Bacteroides ovatus]
MIKHYLKVAFRNLIKYKTQSLVSIIGLAVGFTCFALSVLWIRYEMTYDNFHEGADRIYLVRAHYANEPGTSKFTPYPLMKYLQDKMPEIEAITAFTAHHVKFRMEDTEQEIGMIAADSVFMNFFDIQLLKGTVNFLKCDGQEVAITKEFAKRLFSKKEDALGKEVEVGRRVCKIGAIVSGWSNHSNIPYNILTPARHSPRWGSSNEQLFIRVRERTDIDAFRTKMSTVCINDIEKESELSDLLITRMSALRYSDYVDKADVVISFSYIFYFSLAGGLVIICSLFNYLTLFISRLCMRNREMALRKVNGASNKALSVQFAIELLLLLCIALIGGLLLVEMSMSQFLNFTQIETSSYYGEILVYLLAVIILSFLFALMPLSYFRRRTLQETIKGGVATARPYLFRRIGIIVQLIVSLVFIFCTVVIMKQLCFLKNTDLGMERHRVANVALWNGDINQWVEKIKALPMVTETLPPVYFPIIPVGPMMYVEITNWDGLPKVTEKTLLVGIMPAKEEFFKFYDLKLLEGEFISEKSLQNEVVVDESTCLKFGWKHALGKTFGNNINGRQDIAYKVVGVVKNFSYRSPTSKPGLIAFQRPEAQEYLLNRASILFKFKEGTWNECREAIEKLHKEEFPNAYLRLFSEEEEYGKYLRSEDALMKLLSFVSLVCVLISVFGIFSLVTLSCEQRQKEIAIRKVNGAQIRHILQMFFREYFLLLIIAAVIAFPMGYVVMRQWIETYVRQTAINGWVYVGIFAVMAIIILFCIIWRIWKAARQNPAEVLKSE